jgi:uncharacterized membrane protein YozB (DUF420 family)
MSDFKIFFILITAAVFSHYKEKRWHKMTLLKKAFLTLLFPALYFLSIIVGLYVVISDWYDYEGNKK